MTSSRQIGMAVGRLGGNNANRLSLAEARLEAARLRLARRGVYRRLLSVGTQTYQAYDANAVLEAESEAEMLRPGVWR